MKETKKLIFLAILKRYHEGKASEEEIAYMEAYYKLYDLRPDVLNKENEQELKLALKSKIDQKIDAHEKQAQIITSRKPGRAVFRYAAAALLLLTLSIGVYWIAQRKSASDTGALLAQQDRSPGGRKAILRLGNGEEIILDEAKDGEIARQSSMRIVHTADGQLIYTNQSAEKNTSDQEALSNTITTPNGGQYQVVLSDGTRIWLNAASSITYPTAFDDASREVALTGEAYFEVAENKKAPFRVKTGRQVVEVMGTHFNINSYSDEPLVSTTLLEGAVKVISGNQESILRPGQQARVRSSPSAIDIDKKADVDKVVAWKNGIFSFENEDLKSIMRQVSRWYDVDVVFVGDIPEEKFYGEISKNSKLSEVCKILALNNLHFSIAGRTIKVSGQVQGTAK